MFVGRELQYRPEVRRQISLAYRQLSIDVKDSGLAQVKNSREKG